MGEQRSDWGRQTTKGGEEMSDQQSWWWEQETQADKMLRELASKAKALGRLPTAEDLRADATMPSLPSIAMTTGMNLEQVREELASLLYRRGRQQTSPVELTLTELAKPEPERAKIEREYQEYYEERLAKVLRPNGIRELKAERARPKPKYDESKVVKIPIRPRKELWAEINAAERRRRWNSEGMAEAAAKRTTPDVAVEKTETDSRKAAPIVALGKTGVDFQKADKVAERVVEKMARCTSKEQALEALVKVYQEYGKVTQRTVVAYAAEHKGSGVPAYMTVKKYLGETATWTRQVEEYLQLASVDNSAEIPVGVLTEKNVAEPVVESAPEPEAENEVKLAVEPEVKSEPKPVVEPVGDSPEAVEVQKPPESLEIPVAPETLEKPVEDDAKKLVSKMRLNLTGMTLKFILEGQEYELEVGFGKD